MNCIYKNVLLVLCLNFEYLLTSHLKVHAQFKFLDKLRYVQYISFFNDKIINIPLLNTQNKQLAIIYSKQQQ